MMGDVVGSGARILLVEDFEDAREMYAEFLRSTGYIVVTSIDGQEAVDVAAGGGFDLIIVDIALPKLDGISVVKTLRARVATQQTPIITLSASIDERCARRRWMPEPISRSTSPAFRQSWKVRFASSWTREQEKMPL